MTPRRPFSTDGANVVIPIIIPSLSERFDNTTTDLTLDLANGSVSTVDRNAWAAEKAAFLAPLRGPTINAERE